jgi:hypothetical protein
VLSNTTGTAGNFGVTIFRPLAMIVIPGVANQSFIMDAILSNGCQLPIIQNNACIQHVYWTTAATFGPWNGEFRFIQV